MSFTVFLLVCEVRLVAFVGDPNGRRSSGRFLTRYSRVVSGYPTAVAVWDIPLSVEPPDEWRASFQRRAHRPRARAPEASRGERGDRPVGRDHFPGAPDVRLCSPLYDPEGHGEDPVRAHALPRSAERDDVGPTSGGS